MVNFDELLKKRKSVKPLNPVDIFNNLDKRSTIEYLRPPQEAVLNEWVTNFHNEQDIIIKLHTGQGKTLIGLLILQSILNEGKGPALYLCPNNYLVDQTIEQANIYGIKTVQCTDTKLPQDFLNSEAILVATCNKLFNGKSVFGVRGSQREKINIGAIVIDDAHKCLDIIRDAFSVSAKKDSQIYIKIWELFEESLKRQAAGTHDDIANGQVGFLAVPFWSWYDKHDDVLRILSENKEESELLFVWDLIKNYLKGSICIISEDRVEISPRLLPIETIPSFSECTRRIFLSATLSEDAFLVRDLGLKPESVSSPLSKGDVKYCGERLILIPSLVDPAIQRSTIVNWFQTLSIKYGSFGIVAITPSFAQAEIWKTAGAMVSNVRELYQNIEILKTTIKDKKANKVLVLVNEYDGVDLPDDTCRILILDSLPSYNNLMDKYLHEMRSSSGIVLRQIAQRIEQGMGRAIRGSSDWCIVIITGTNLSEFLSQNIKRGYLSNEARLQIKIGEDLVKELRKEGRNLLAIERLVNQCLSRYEGWKEYYKQEMANLQFDSPQINYLEKAQIERQAEIYYKQGQYQKAVETIQNYIDKSDKAEKGWYLQLMATYIYPIDKKEAMNKQITAHEENENLFRPEIGMTYSKITSSDNRSSRILRWIKTHNSYNEVILSVRQTMDNLLFGTTETNIFEENISKLGEILGFTTDRPEKKTGEGPDNLWGLQGKLYWIIECKHLILSSRGIISKKEAGQMNVSIAWFKTKYEGDEGIPIFIHPAENLAPDAYLSHTPAYSLTQQKFTGLKNSVTDFYTSLITTPFNNLNIETINQKLKDNHLEINDLSKNYTGQIPEKS